MTRPVAYRCSRLDAEAWPDRCLDFSPSLAKTKVNREMTWAEYEKFQRDCRRLSSDEGKFRAAGCKREAHRQLTQGREGTRYGVLTGPLRLGADGLSYEVRVTTEGKTPMLRRTQSPLAAPDARQGVFVERREKKAAAGATAQAVEAQVLAVLRREAGPDERLMLNRPKAAQLLAQLGDLVRPERAQELLDALGTRTERFFGEQADSQGESNLPEIVRDLAFAAEVYQAAPLMRLADKNPLVLKTPSTGWYVSMGKRDEYRLLRVLVGNAQIEVKPLVEQLQNQAQRLASPRTGRGLTTDEKGEAARLSQVQQLAFFRLLRREMERHEGDVTFVFGFGGREGRVEVARSTLQHSEVSASRSRKRKPDYTRLTFLTLPELAAFLAGTTDLSRRRTLRGRRLPPVTVARSNPMARPKFVNLPDYTDLQPGELRPIPSDPLYCVYRKTGRNAHLLPLEAQFEITTCSRAQSWQRLNQRAPSIPVEPRPLRPALSQENPMTRGRRNPPFDPLAELMREYGPQARLGEHQASLAPEYNSTYPASGGYGPYGLSDAPYGGQAMLPVNRRNPNGGHAHARRNAGDKLDMNQKGLKWRDFVRAYGEPRNTFIVPTPLASQKWAEYKRLHGIVTDPKVAERLRSLGKSKKARKNGGDDGETAPLSPWDHESEYELVRGAYGPGSEMPPVNRRNPNGGHARRNPAHLSVSYDHLSDAQLTFLSNTGDEHASHELARRNPRSSGKRQKRQLQERMHAARASMEREAEETRYAQGSANARARFEQEDRRREAERAGRYLAEQRSRDAERDAYLYNPRGRR